MDITPRLHPENSAHGHAQNSRAGSATGPSTSGHRPSPGAGAGSVPGAGYYTPSHTTAKRRASSSPGPGPASDPGTDTTVTTPTNTNAAANNNNHHPNQYQEQEQDQDQDQEQDAPRPPRACEACRSLKVRCEPDTQDPRGACKRCVRTRRECVVTAPTRKRQKKTDSRVAELERKIDALTASMGRGVASAGASAGAVRGDGLGNGAGASAPAGTGSTGKRWLGGKPAVTAPMSGSAIGSPEMTGMKRNFNGEVKNRELDPGPGPGLGAGLNSSTLSSTRPNTPSRWRVNWSSSEPEPTSGFVDVIDKGIVTLEVATEAFNVYINQMSPQLPIVVFSPGTQMTDVRRSKPILFHSILAISIGTVQPDVQTLLVEDFYKIIAERVVVKGEKSLELVQAVLISSIWYMPPDNFEELKFYQLIHMAVTLAMDIGMCRRTMTTKKLFTMKDLMGKKAFALDLDSPETRRAWVGCYYLSVQCVFALCLVLIICVRIAKSSRVSAALRRVPLVRWHSYMDECIEILETSPDALPSDKALLRWVKLAQITEEVGFHFSSDEPDSNATFFDPKIQYTLRAFEKQLEQWRKDTPAEHYSLIMRQTDYLLNTYIHEPTMHIDSTTADQNLDNGHQEQPPPPPPTSPAFIDALTNCLICVHRSLDIILSMDTRSLLLLPTYVLGRTSYAMVALMRLYAIITAPETQLSQVIDPATLNVDHYLGRIVEHYKAAGEHPGGRAPAKFSVVLGLLRNWFVKQNDQSHPTLREALGGGFGRCGHLKDLPVHTSKTRSMEGNGSNNHNRDVNRLRMGPSPTTPLHLLSEVAMGEGETRSRPGSGSESNSNSNIASFPHQHQHPTSIGSLVSQPLPSNQQQPWLHQYPSPTPPRYPHPHQHASTYQTPASTGTTAYADPIATATTAAITSTTAANQFFMPETSLPVGMGFEPENLFTLGDMFGDGFFNFPFATAEGQW